MREDSCDIKYRAAQKWESENQRNSERRMGIGRKEIEELVYKEIKIARSKRFYDLAAHITRYTYFLLTKYKCIYELSRASRLFLESIEILRVSQLSDIIIC